MKLFLSVTNIIISQNIHISSWITLYLRHARISNLQNTELIYFNDGCNAHGRRKEALLRISYKLDSNFMSSMRVDFTLSQPTKTLGTRRGWGVSVTPRPHLTSRKDPVPILQEAGWASGPVWTGAENLAPTGIRSPDRPVRRQSLHRLSYRGPQLNLWIWIAKRKNKTR
jgi:hypothetical protein